MQQEEEAYQQQRRRLYSEVQEEKERLSQQASRHRIELDRLQRQLEDQTNNATDAMRKEYEKARDEQERRHEVENTAVKFVPCTLYMYRVKYIAFHRIF